MILVDENELYDMALDVEECSYFEMNDVSKRILRRVAAQLFEWAADPNGEYIG